MRFGQSVLITSHGERIVVRYPTKLAEDVIDDMLNHMERAENWSVVNHEETMAFQKDQRLYIVNMNSITGVGE